MSKLDELREKISEIDLKIVRLISQRAKIAIDIAKQKEKHDSSLFRPSREQEVFLFIDQNNPGPLENVYLHNIYREIMSSTLSIEGRLRIAYFGPKGSFTHQAALKKFGNSLQLNPYFDVNGVFEAVQKKNAEYGVLPIENSTAGKVTHTLDALLDYDLHIYSEVHLSIHHCLLGLTKSLAGIKKIYTHPQARLQCRKWLSKNLPQAEWMETSSTSRAAELVAQEKDESVSAIASAASADVYGLKVIQEKIEDADRNFTRFVVVGRKSAEPSRKDRTSIVIRLPHKPGSLHEILDMISKANVNLTSIESRPSRNEIWSYVFYIDFEGHEKEEPASTLLEQIKEKTSFFRNLGSYPMDVTHQ